MEVAINFLQDFLAQFGIALEPKMNVFEVFSTIGLILGAILYAPYHFIRSQFTSTQANRESILPWLEEKDLAEKYKSIVRWLNMQLQKIYGDARSAKAFARSWSIAMIYPIMLFLIAYTFFSGSHEFAGMALFPESGKNRVVYFLFVILLATIYTSLISRLERLGIFLRKPFKLLFKRVWRQEQGYRLTMALCSVLITMIYGFGWVELLMAASLGYLLGISGFAMVSGLTVVFTFPFDFTVIGIMIIIYAAHNAFFYSGGGVVVGVITTIVITALSAGGMSNGYGYAIFFASFSFLVIFPLLNALFDWLSLQVSRYFLKIVVREDSPLLIFIDILSDLIMAIIFMLALVLVLPAVVEWFNYLYGLFDPTANVDWRSYAQAALSQPFGKGLMVTTMLISTLIPTLLHVMLGLFAFLINSLFGKRLAKYLRDVGEVSWKASLAAIWVQLYFYFVLIITIIVIYLFKQILHLPIGQWLYNWAEWGHNKPVVVVVIILLMTGLGSIGANKSRHS